MLGYLVRRIAISIPLLLAVLFAVFMLLHALPGDPTHSLLGNQWTPEAARRIAADEGLNDPIPVQFARYLRDVAQLDLGTSQKKTKVADELRTRLPATIELAAAAMLVATVFGLVMGVTSAMKPRSWRDLAALGVSLVGVSVPIFWLGLIVQRTFRRGGAFTEMTGLVGLPPDGRLSDQITAQIDLRIDRAAILMGKPISPTGFHLIDAVFVFHDTHMFFDALAHLVLPAIVLATVPAAMIMRITRAAVGEQLAQDYVRTARAKGAGRVATVYRHALGNAAIPIVTSVGTQLGYLLGGAVLTETIFNWPGLGRYIVNAIMLQDVRPLQAAVLVIAVGFVVINLLVDLSYAVLDPRVRLEGAQR